MAYTKPEIAVLGTAASTIENLGPGKNQIAMTDGGFVHNPAYDLDD